MAWQTEMAATIQHQPTPQQQQQQNGGLLASSTSPTPSLDSLTGLVLSANTVTNSDATSVSGIGELTSTDSGLATCTTNGSSADRVSSSSASSSGLGSSPLGNGSVFASSNSTKCVLCSGTYDRPKVLNCFHTFCQACLEKVQDHPEKVTCPHCHTDTALGSGGVAGLMSDSGVAGIIENNSTGVNPSSGIDFGATFCTGCKSRESAPAVARCMTCANFLCPNCVMAHQFMHCFEGHHVTTLGELTSKNGHRTEIQELEGINRVVQEGKSKAQEIRNNLKNLETTSTKLSNHYNKAQNEINETFQFYTSLLEERKAEIMRDLDGHYSAKQMALNVYSQKAQESVDKIYQVTDFIERLMKHASNGEVLLFKRPIEQKFSALLTGQVADIFCLNEDEIVDFEFISNPQAIQASVKNTFGYVRSRNSSGSNSVGSVGTHVGHVTHAGHAPVSKQPPISRPTSSNSSGTNSTSNNHVMFNISSASNSLSNGLAQGMATLAGGQQHLKDFMMDQRQQQQQHQQHQQQQQQQSSAAFLANQTSSAAIINNNVMFDANGMMSKRYNPGSSLIGPIQHNGLGDLSSSASNPYEKWSNGSDMMFGMDNAFGPNNDSLLELSSKLLSLGSGGTGGGGVGPFPPKSQIKRQKMVYHCKFGEFGVLEGQFTEPSGVAVNAQNDIVVADTNNHRIQIFDKEGRFKFQFGECGKRDGQLLYPNRVAVVRSSGDIIVTERSPTHQVQIYNQYGQFVRKFGANILQHPRGVCVDNKGRIIVVECKVMRVIIFDQAGNVLNKFGCSKHLEFPNGVVVNDRQEIFISDNRAHCVKVFNYEGAYLRQIGGEGITNYPIGVGINAAGEVIIADNHNNFNLSVFSQDGQLLAALESKVKHAQCFDVSLMDDGSVVLASKDYRLYIYRYVQVPPIGI